MSNLADANNFFSLVANDGLARAGLLQTAHGTIETPIFMPVGTVGSVKAIATDDLLNIQAPIILGNTYHLYLRPGDELIARHGGLHQMSAWPGAILTDSGGFQIFSLSKLRKITEEGVEFRSHLNGEKLFFSPENIIKIQTNLGSDIIMPLDECVPYGADYNYTASSCELTYRWALRALKVWQENRSNNHLFAIVQGGFFDDLRQRSLDMLTAQEAFSGFAIGGLSVGETKSELHSFLAKFAPKLPVAKPRYLMGVGTPLDIAFGIASGVDMFDCVLPTRNARNGTLYTSTGKINIKRKEYAEADEVLDAKCNCYTCRTYSRAWLRHLFTAQELVSFRLLSLHNLTYFLNLVREARKAILEQNYQNFLQDLIAIYPDEAAEIQKIT